MRVLKLCRNKWAQVGVAILAILILLAIISSVFGITGKICEQTKEANKANCGHYNLALFVLIQLYKVLNNASTLITAIATAILTYVTYLLVKLGKEQAETAGRQIAISGTQADIQLKQQQIERLEFIATHRPRLRIRRIWPVGKGTFLGNESTEIRIIVANVGEAEARITKLSAHVIFEREIAKRHSFQADSATSDYREPLTVPRGKQVQINASSTLQINPTVYDGPRGKQFEVLAIGVIEYEDSAGGIYLTGFSRLYDPTSNRFRVAPENDPEADREYED